MQPNSQARQAQDLGTRLTRWQDANMSTIGIGQLHDLSAIRDDLYRLMMELDDAQR